MQGSLWWVQVAFTPGMNWPVASWSLATCLANAAVWTKRDHSECNGARTERLATKDFVMFCVLMPFCEHLSWLFEYVRQSGLSWLFFGMEDSAGSVCLNSSHLAASTKQTNKLNTFFLSSFPSFFLFSFFLPFFLSSFLPFLPFFFFLLFSYCLTSRTGIPPLVGCLSAAKLPQVKVASCIITSS